MAMFDTEYASVVMMLAYRDFDAYSTAKKELYLERLAELGMKRPPGGITREDVDAWKARIQRGDDLYPRGIS